MRKPFIAAALAASALLAACGGANPPATSRQNSNAQANAAQTSIQHGPSPSSNIGVASSHGGGADAAGAAGGSNGKAPVETPQLDAKIEKAKAKAKAPGASAADKKAAAEAYIERGNFYYSAGNPMLYRYALGDFRRVLRYDPDNAEAKEKVKQIEDIYTYSVKKPIPTNGLDDEP